MSRTRPGMDRVVVFFGCARDLVIRRIKREVVNAQFHEMCREPNSIGVGWGDDSAECVGKISVCVIKWCADWRQQGMGHALDYLGHASSCWSLALADPTRHHQRVIARSFRRAPIRKAPIIH